MMNRRLKVKQRRKRFVALLLSFLITLSLSVTSFANVLPTDTPTAKTGNFLIEVPGTFDAESKEAIIARLNEIRYEACREGVPNPKDRSKKLTTDDYVPVKWSSLMEQKVRIRAAEAAIGGYDLGHTRPNGEKCFTVKSTPDYFSSAENLAWNKDTHAILTGIEQWYGEKNDWINDTPKKVTGHYTNMIDPAYDVTAVAAFVLERGSWQNVAQQSSSSNYNPQSSLDETKDTRTGKQTQVIEVNPKTMQNKQTPFTPVVSITDGADTLKEGESAQFQANVALNGYQVHGTPSITWSWNDSQSNSLASVDDTGKLTANKEGSGNLVATVNGYSAQKQITITKKETVKQVKSIASLPDMTIVEGIDPPLALPTTVEVTWSDDTKTNETLTWAQPDPSKYAQVGDIQLSGSLLNGTQTVTQKIHVVAKQVTKVEWAAKPTKTEYEFGETLDTTGGRLKVFYDNGKSEEMGLDAQDVAITGYDGNVAGNQNVTVTYDGKSVMFSVTVKAKATPPAVEEFTITVDPSGGNWDGETQPRIVKVKKGENFTLPEAPTKDGYTFAYWEGSQYQPGQQYTVTENHTFTAKWNKNSVTPNPPAPEEFTITVDPSGGNWNGDTQTKIVKVKKGESFTLPEAPTKDGYTFAYWEGSQYQPGQQYTVTEDHTFTAKWNKNSVTPNPPDNPDTPNPPAVEEFTITISPSGGNWNGDTQPRIVKVKKGDFLTLPEAPTKDGYTFAYWEGSQYQPGEKYPVTENHTFTAKWNKNSATPITPSVTPDTTQTSSSTTTSVTTGTSTTSNTNKTKDAKAAPKTGEETMLAYYASVFLVAAGAVLFLSKKNKIEQ